MKGRRRTKWILLALLALVVVGALAARQPGVKSQLDVQYGMAGGQPLLLDVYRPSAPGENRPAVLMIHGGGWVAGSKKDCASLGEGLAKQGFVAFGIDYRLATDMTNKMPAQIDDVQRSVRWIRAHAATFGVNPNKLGAFGTSAGGHLVAVLGTTDTRDNSDPALARYSSRVNCVIDTCGPTDFTTGEPLSPQASSLIPKVFGKSLKQAPALYRLASPALHADKRSAPFIIFHGTKDELVPVDQAQRMYDALRRAGVEATLVKFDGAGHSFTNPDQQRQWLLQSLAFLNKHLK